MANAEIWVAPNPLTVINWTPSLIEELYQNVGNILGTMQGEVMLFREFGIDANIIDQPMTAAQRLLMADVVQKVHKFEPRVRVTKVQLINTGTAATAAGTMVPRVCIKIKDEAFSNE